MPEAPLWRRVERAWHMARHVPPGMVLRRLERLARGRLDALLPGRNGPPPPLADIPPLPLLPPRRGQLTRLPTGWRLALPWSVDEIHGDIDWHAPAASPAAVHRRARLHEMAYLEALDDADLVALVDDWIARNPCRPETRRYAWRPFILSIRTVVWMQQLAARRQHLDPAFVSRAAASLTAQLRFLERHLETDLRGNHLIKNLKALLWAGGFFAGPEAARWHATGSRLLAAELDEQILEDGCQYERSPSYQCQVMADLLECRLALAAGALSGRLDAGLARMAEATVRLAHPDGGVALLNDSGLDAAYPPGIVLDAHGRLTGRPTAPPRGPFALPAAGYYGLRQGGDYLLVDCGPIGPDYLVGHGHGDILSFEWSTGGQRIVVDPGTYQYHAGPQRQRTRATASHNTLSIDDADQCDFYGAYRCGRRAVPRLLAWRPDAEGCLLEGTHDGFARLPGRPCHIRRLVAGPGALTIHDRVLGQSPHRAVAGLLLHPDCTIEPDGTIAGEAGRLRIRRAGVEVEVEADAPIRIEPGEWYPDLYVARPTHRLRITVPVGGPGTTVSLRRVSP